MCEKDKSNRYKAMRKAYRIRTRQTPIIEGVYRMKHPLLILIRPRICFVYNEKRTRAKASIRCFHKTFLLQSVKDKGTHLVYSVTMDSIAIDLVIRFYKRDAFDGFFDTPIGQMRITGVYDRSLYKERSLWKKRKKQFK